VKITTNGTLTALAFVLVGTLMGFRSVAVEAVYPVERAKQTFSRRVLTRVVGFFRGAEARAENVRLRREVDSLAMLRTDLDRLEAENARLRRALEYRERNPGEWIAAGVLTTDGGAASVRNTLRVDKGSLAGIREGAVVAVPDGLVGRVTSVTPHTSEILLLTDPSIKVSCEIESAERGGLRGILGGGTSDGLCLRHLTGVRSEALPRSRVLTTGLGGVFPRGLEVGTLLEIRKDEKGRACEGEVLPAVDYSTLEDVFIRREK